MTNLENVQLVSINVLQKKINQISVNEEEELDSDLPLMPQNVLGLNHANILKKVSSYNIIYIN